MLVLTRAGARLLCFRCRQESFSFYRRNGGTMKSILVLVALAAIFTALIYLATVGVAEARHHKHHASPSPTASESASPTPAPSGTPTQSTSAKPVE